MAAPQRLLDSTEIGGFHRSILLTCQAGGFSWSRVHALHGSAAPIVVLAPIDAERDAGHCSALRTRRGSRLSAAPRSALWMTFAVGDIDAARACGPQPSSDLTTPARAAIRPEISRFE
jgi:hypothetical protein